MEHFSVVVVGGGPAGSSAAITLAVNRGLRVLLIDSRQHPRPKPCGDFLNPVATRLLSTRSLLGDSLGTFGTPLTSLSLYSSSGHRIRGEFDAGSPAYGVCRRELDHRLLDRARASGVEVREGVRFLRARKVDGRVVGATLETGGVEVDVGCDLLIGADGVRSRVSRSLGLQHRATGRVALVTRVTVREDIHEASMLLGEVADLGLCPVTPRVLSAGFLVEPRALRRTTGTPRDRFLSLCTGFPHLARLVPGMELLEEPAGWGRFRVQSRAAGIPGMALVGDALGFDDPLPGNGVELALRTVSILGQVCDDEATVDLTTYSRKLEEELAWRRFSSRLLFRLTRRPRLNDIALRLLQALGPAGDVLIRGFQGAVT